MIDKKQTGMERQRINHFKREDSIVSDTSDIFSPLDDRKLTRKLVTPSSSLEIVDGEGAHGFAYERSPSEASSRPWSRSSVGSVPPRCDSSLSRRTLTPTKQVSLQAVRRREENVEPFVDHIDVDSVKVGGNTRKPWENNSKNVDDVDISSLSVGDQRNSGNQFKHGPHANSASKPNAAPHNTQGQNKMADNKYNSENKNSDSDDDDDEEDENDEEDDDKDENEKLKAPTELLMEFIDCLVKKDFPNASKLCKMILLYEPENEEALKFQPLIDEKMALDAAAEEESSGDDDSDDDDDDDSEDDSSDDDDSSEEDDDENENEIIKNESSALPELSSGHTTKDDNVIGANSKKVWKPAN